MIGSQLLLCQQPASSEAIHQTLPLKECLRVAMEKNHSRPASAFAIAVAEAQHRQSLAGYWPQITAKAGITRMDEPLNFMFPASQMYIPPQQVAIPGGTATVTIPANAFAPGFPPTTVQLPVSYPGQNITTNSQLFPIPAQNVKLLNPTLSMVEGDFKWLLFDGGMRQGYKEQALAAIGVARAEAHRTDLELADSVIRFYYGAVLARRLRQLGQETLERMEATLRITESLYTDGAGTVTKADYLDNKVMVETIRSVVAPLEKNQLSAEAALAYTMGLPWNATIEPADTEIPYVPYNGEIADLVATAYEFNPDWKKIEAGLEALAGELKTAQSGRYPKLALTGDLHRFWNNYDGGISTPQNRAGWSVGAGVEVPIFDGFVTAGRVAEARAKLNKLQAQKLLLKEGIGLQIRDLFLSLQASEKTYKASSDALTAARDDRELTSRAYETGLLATEKVIRAQLQEALVSASYYKVVYEHRALQSGIDLVVGRSVQNAINGQ